MATHRLCFSGMDSAELEALTALFNRINRRLGAPFTLASESEADILVVDVDSIYGHMTWLRMHNRPGLTVVAVSQRHSPESDHTLLRPVDEARLSSVLETLAGTTDGGTPPPAPQAAPEPAAPLQPPAAPARVAAAEAKPAPPVAEPRQVAVEQPAIPVEPLAPEPRPRDPELGDYLRPGALPGPARLDIEGAPPLVIDPGAKAYLGPAQLKGFIPYCQRVIQPTDWAPVGAAELATLASRLGTPQSWTRLVWLHGLVSGGGQLREGLGSDDRFRLLKWPQIEREYPKHFRIATAMMKGPQTMAEIIEASGTGASDVADFINASLAAGQAERMEAEPEATGEPAGRGGLLGRLRGKKG